jgi:hypothetical protein
LRNTVKEIRAHTIALEEGGRLCQGSTSGDGNKQNRGLHYQIWLLLCRAKFDEEEKLKLGVNHEIFIYKTSPASWFV